MKNLIRRINDRIISYLDKDKWDCPNNTLALHYKSDFEQIAHILSIRTGSALYTRFNNGLLCVELITGSQCTIARLSMSGEGYRATQLSIKFLDERFANDHTLSLIARKFDGMRVVYDGGLTCQTITTV